jgi:hypothetical protein
MGDNPKPKPWTQAEFDAQFLQASKEALRRSRELLESMKAQSGLQAGTAPTNARLAELRSLVNHPAVQEHIAGRPAGRPHGESGGGGPPLAFRAAHPHQGHEAVPARRGPSPGQGVAAHHAMVPAESCGSRAQSQTPDLVLVHALEAAPYLYRK